MAWFEGTYQLNDESDENYLKYVLSFNILSEEAARDIIATKKLVHISDVEDNSITVDIGNKPIKWVYGKEFETSLFTGHSVKAIASRNGNTITFRMVLAEDPTLFEEKVYQFTEKGLVAVSTNNAGITAILQYLRL